MKLLNIISAFCLLVTGVLTEGIKSKNDAGVLIVGGRIAEEGEVPYHLSLIKNDTEYGAVCGGVLVNVTGHQVGLTSSSCFVNDNTSVPWDVMAGYMSLYYLEETQRTAVEKIVRHPNYKDSNLTSDIAILFFQPFVINGTVNSIPLPGTGQTTPQGRMTVSGWGSVDYGERSAYNLRVLNVTVVNSTVCEQDFGKDLTGTFCAKNEETNTTPYLGDEGGPAVSHGGYLSGIFIKADLNISAIFTDIANFTTWIDTTVKEYYA